MPATPGKQSILPQEPQPGKRRDLANARPFRNSGFVQNVLHNLPLAGFLFDSSEGLQDKVAPEISSAPSIAQEDKVSKRMIPGGSAMNARLTRFQFHGTI